MSFGVEASRPICLGPRVTSEIYGGVRIEGELLDGSRRVTSAFVAGGPGAATFDVNEKGAQGLGGTLSAGTVIGSGRGLVDLGYAGSLSAAGVTTHRLSVTYLHRFGDLSTVRAGLTAPVSRDQSDDFSAEMFYDLRWLPGERCPRPRRHGSLGGALPRPRARSRRLASTRDGLSCWRRGAISPGSGPIRSGSSDTGAAVDRASRHQRHDGADRGAMFDSRADARRSGRVAKASPLAARFGIGWPGTKGGGTDVHVA